MKYVIYLRVSTDQQAQSGHGLEAQRSICYQYISNKGEGCSVLEFSDEGISGSKSLEKRPQLFAAINALEKGDVLLISKRDRIGRDPIVNAMIERAVQRKNARLISASGDVSDSDDPSSILMKRMVDAFAEYERLIIGQRTKVALAQKKKNNQRVGYIPFGYKLAEDKIHLEINEDEQNVLKMIRMSRKEGASFRKIAEEFNEMQILNRFLRPWNHVSIIRVMK